MLDAACFARGPGRGAGRFESVSCALGIQQVLLLELPRPVVKGNGQINNNFCGGAMIWAAISAGDLASISIPALVNAC